MFENQSVSEEFEFCYILNITEAFKNGVRYKYLSTRDI